MNNRFVHLRLKSSYSIAASMLRPKAIFDWAVKNNAPALGICDAGNLFGAVELAEGLTKAGVQPIIGCELTVSYDVDGFNKARAPIALLPQNEAGWLNLLDLASTAYLDADAIGPQITLAQLLSRSAGLILLSGGQRGRLASLVASGRLDAARTLAETLSLQFLDRHYIELQRGVGATSSAQQAVEQGLVSLAYEIGLPLVGTQDARCLSQSDVGALDALFCISQSKVLSQKDRVCASEADVLATPEAMATAFADLPEAITNTFEIAQRCSHSPGSRKPILPQFSVDETKELRAQAHAGLEDRLGSDATLYDTRENYFSRLDYELSVIAKMGFDGYFLIVSDFIKWAKRESIPVGPGRGSGAGSVVAWALSITDLDPLRFGLLFERFLNPERVSMPDCDIDFCQDRRGEVIDYVRRRYGDDRVAHIITFGTLQARAVLRDVGRVMQLPYGQVDKLAKLVPFNPAAPVTLEIALEQEPRLKEARSNADVDALIATAVSLEGLYRNASTHAAGVVITDRPLVQLTPLYKDRRSELPATQYNMKWAEAAGLVKFDFLGLKTLTVIQKAIRFLEAEGETLTPAWEALDDPEAYRLMSSGETLGVFQLESQGMRDTLRKVKPDKMDDVIALISLYRPGPMKNIDTYVNVKFKRMAPDYLHPSLEPILKETYGIIVYQEQVMQIAQTLAGYSLGDADLLRRAMGKKKKEEMDKQRETFVSQAISRGVEGNQAAHIFDLVAEFAGYGFNKSHAAAYAVIAYQTAYLKARHPGAFLAASMSLDIDDTNKLAAFIQEARRLKVEIVPPLINSSEADFVFRNGKLHYALGALKGVGLTAMEGVVAVRKRQSGRFATLHAFADAIDPKLISRRVLETLARAGVFDELEPSRASALAAADALLASAQSAQEDRDSKQTGLFADDCSVKVRLPDIPDWSATERLSEEFAAIGFYLSGHPLEDIMLGPARSSLVFAFEMMAKAARSSGFDMIGVVRARVEKPAKSGGKFAYLSLSDPTGIFELFVPPEMLEEYRDVMEVGSALKLRVRAQRKEEEIRLSADHVEPLERARLAAPSGLAIRVNRHANLNELKGAIQSLTTGLANTMGRVELQIALADGRTANMALPGRYRVDFAAISLLKSQVGVERVYPLAA